MKTASTVAIVKSFIGQYTKDDTRKAIVGWSVAINVIIFNIAFIQTINYFLPTNAIARVVSYWCLWVITMVVNLTVLCCYHRECLCFKGKTDDDAGHDEDIAHITNATKDRMPVVKPGSVAINIKAETKLDKPARRV